MGPINNPKTIIAATNLFDTSHVDPVNLIPKEVISLILSNLEDIGLQLSSAVNKQWFAASVDAGKLKELKSINLCLELAIEFLENKDCEDKDIIHDNNLGALYEFRGTEIIGINLQQVKLSSDCGKEKLLNVLKNLNCEDLLKLSFLLKTGNKNLFNIAKIYQEIEIIELADTNWKIEKREYFEKHPNSNIVYSNRYPNLSNRKFSKKIDELASLGHFNKAVELTKKSTFDLEILFTNLNKAQIYKSINPALTLLENLLNNKNEKQLSVALNALSLFTENPTFFQRIFKLAEETKDFTSKYPAFGNISGGLLNFNENASNNIVKIANKIASGLPDNVLVEISLALMKDGKKDEATKVAKQIKVRDLRKSTRAEIRSDDKYSCIIM